MKPFRFRLERLLGLREAAKRDRARALGEAAQAAVLAGRAAAAGAAQQQRAEGQLAQSLATVTPAGLYASLGTALAHIAAAGAQQADASRAADQTRRDAQTAYEQARRATGSLERLSAIRHDAYRLEAARDERRQMDEIAARYRRAPDGQP